MGSRRADAKSMDTNQRDDHVKSGDKGSGSYIEGTGQKQEEGKRKQSVSGLGGKYSSGKLEQIRGKSAISQITSSQGKDN